MSSLRLVAERNPATKVAALQSAMVVDGDALRVVGRTIDSFGWARASRRRGGSDPDAWLGPPRRGPRAVSRAMVVGPQCRRCGTRGDADPRSSKAGTSVPPAGEVIAIGMAPWHHIGGIHVGSVMTITIKVDRQGRVVIPQAERERLGLSGGGALELVSTPEGVLLERRRRATVTVDESGLPLVTVDELDTVTNATTVEAIHAQRDRA